MFLEDNVMKYGKLVALFLFTMLLYALFGAEFTSLCLLFYLAFGKND